MIRFGHAKAVGPTRLRRVLVSIDGADAANFKPIATGALVAPEWFAEMGHDAPDDVAYWIAAGVTIGRQSSTGVDMYVSLYEADEADIETLSAGARQILDLVLARRPARSSD